MNLAQLQQCHHTAKDVFFMTCATFKTGGKWTSVAKPFAAVPGTFQTMITKFIQLIAPLLYEVYVEGELDGMPMDIAINSGRAFRNYPCARYATDVTFQQTTEPTHGQDQFYSAKHKLHGLKVEVSVSPLGRAVNCTASYPGATADITIFRRNSPFHERALLKRPGLELEMQDDGPSFGPDQHAYPRTWGVLVDKGYVDLQPAYRAIHPTKHPPRGRLTPLQHETNKKISKDRIVVENFLGRLCTLWLIAQDRYWWSRELYPYIIKALVALTNAHVKIMPLRREDGDARNLYEQRLYALGVQASERRRRDRIAQREQERHRLEFSLNSLPAQSGLDDDDGIEAPRSRHRSRTSSDDNDETQL